VAGYIPPAERDSLVKERRADWSIRPADVQRLEDRAEELEKTVGIDIDKEHSRVEKEEIDKGRELLDSGCDDELVAEVVMEEIERRQRNATVAVKDRIEQIRLKAERMRRTMKGESLYGPPTKEERNQ
jgi:hypothetical protein